MLCARLAQMVERMTLNHVVAGSIPAVGVSYYHTHIKLSVDSSMVRIRAFQARGPGSIPGRRMTFIISVGLWCNWLAQWTLNPLIRVQIPAGPIITSCAYIYLLALVAQWIAHWTSNPEVAGSNPVKSVLIVAVEYNPRWCSW